MPRASEAVLRQRERLSPWNRRILLASRASFALNPRRILARRASLRLNRPRSWCNSSIITMNRPGLGLGVRLLGESGERLRERSAILASNPARFSARSLRLSARGASASLEEHVL